MSDASQSASNAAQTTSNARESLKSASRSIDPISNAVDETAELAEGICQFPGTNLGCQEAERFQSYSVRINSLERNLGDTANSLQRNSRDMEKMSEDFKKISESLNRLSQNTPNVAGAGLHNLKLVLYGLLGWIGMLHTAILGIGVMLWKVDSFVKS